jgi:hypothetical protein
MKTLLFLILVVPIIGIAQTEIKNKYIPQVNILHADFRQVNFHNPTDSIYLKSFIKLCLNTANDNKFLLDSAFISRFKTPADSSLTKNYYKYDSKGNRILELSNSSCFDCTSGVPGKVESQFDQNGNCTMYIVYLLTPNKKYIPEFKVEQNYNLNGKPIQEYRYIWEEITNQWINDSKNENTYDDNGALLSTVSCRWNKDQSIWIYYYKMDQSFDQEGNIVWYADYYYDKETVAWLGNKKRESVYGNNKLVLFVESNWNEDLMQWINSQKIEYTYDSTGNKTMEIIYSWNVFEMRWENDYKYDYSILPTGKVAVRIAFTSDISNQWVESFKEEYTYDSNVNEILKINSQMDTTLNQWILQDKYERIYDLSNLLISDISYSWNQISNSWIPVSENDFSFDSNGNNTKESYYNWDAMSSKWKIYYKFEYFYSLHSITDKTEISNSPNPIVFPNPATDFITITSPATEAGKCSLSLLDSQGRLLQKKEVEISGNYKLNISGIKNGIYFLNLRWADRQLTKQIIKTDFK